MTEAITDLRKAGIALLVGSIGGVVTMAVHPVNGDTHLVIASGIAHSLAIASVLLLFMGTCGLTYALQAPDRIAFAALVTYAFAVVAVSIAAAVSGWVVPGILGLEAKDIPANGPQWHMIIAGIFQINQAFSRIYSVAGSVAIVLWSAGCLRHRRLSRGFALFGCVTAPLIALLIAVGHLRLNVHGMSVVMVSQVVWFGGMGAALLREHRKVASARSSHP